MSIPWSSAIGFFMGFAFGVGCALAVLYSIFLGGYRAALRDLELDPSPPRLLKAEHEQLAADSSKLVAGGHTRTADAATDDSADHVPHAQQVN